MKKQVKILMIALMLFAATAVTITVFNATTETVEASSGSWRRDKKGWWYRNPNGSYPKNAWKKVSGKWYFFDKSGYMKTGWLKDKNKWYYLANSGAMVSNKWMKDSKGWCFLGKDGAMYTNMWLKYDNKWYYLDNNGTMASNGIYTDQKSKASYYIAPSGVMQAKKWTKLPYKGEGGGSYWIYSKADGKLAVNQWVDNKFYLDEDGWLLKNTWVGEYHVNKDGKWDKTCKHKWRSLNSYKGSADKLVPFVREGNKGSTRANEFCDKCNATGAYGGGEWRF